MGKGMDNIFNIGNMLKQAQKLKSGLAEKKKELELKVIEGSAGGGKVKVTVNGIGDVLSIKIDEEVIDSSNKGKLEDLVLSAVSDGIKKSRELLKEEMKDLTGGMDIPGLF